MISTTLIDELTCLPVDDKIFFSQVLWESVAENNHYFNLPQEHLEIIQDRLKKIMDGEENFEKISRFLEKFN